ncbi:MAG: hypothetical protein R3296_10010 [Oleiphilaceae bacterium]|nr:hypothetical protein [Oleiphilaceae bacterium]
MNHKAQSKGIYARFCRVERISVHEIRQMYEIFQRYYHHTDIETFLKDLSNKTGVVLVRTRGDKDIVGFTTVRILDMEAGGLRGKGFFSGDTILERQYWGNKAMHLGLFRVMLREKLRRPWRPVFWLLISKGYKTFLLMANNFENYYPNPENRRPELKRLVWQYCEDLFPGVYDPQKEVLDFGDVSQCLREDVAAVSDELRRREPKIDFFQRRNPEWHRGTELPCIGIVDARTLLAFALKSLRGVLPNSRRTAGVRSTQ